MTTLDDYASFAGEIGLIKIDVEGHEGAVMEGAAMLLAGRRIRDIIFEDYHPQPSAVTKCLRASGYDVFCIWPGWRKPFLLSLEQRAKLPTAEPHVTTFLATRNPDRSRARFKEAGWKCLSARARLKAA